MRILIISDSHENTDNIEKIIKKEEKFDLVIHCGDGTRDFDYIGDRLKCRVNGVSGNCDMISFEPSVKNFGIEGKVIHLEHGNRLPINKDSDLLDYAEVNGYDVFMYGHTHVQKIINNKGRWVINPGSISRPKDGFPSYIVMITDGKGNFEFEAKRI